MLTVDISNIWCSVSLPEFVEMEPALNAAGSVLCGAVGRTHGWLEQAASVRRLALSEIADAAEEIRRTSDYLVVVGAGLSCAGAAAAVRMYDGRRPGGVQLLFLGNDFSTSEWQTVSELLEARDYSVLLTAEAGKETAPLIAMRALHWAMEKKYGRSLSGRVYVAPPERSNVLARVAVGEGWHKLDLPELPWGDRSALNPAGLLIMAAAGLDHEAVYAGAAETFRACTVRELENPLWLYVGARRLLHAHGASGEQFCTPDPAAEPFGRWWVRVMNSVCREGRGCPAEHIALPGDLISCGGLLLDPERGKFGTLLQLPPPAKPVPVEMDWKNLDGLGGLHGLRVSDVEEKMLDTVRDAMAEREIPFLVLTCTGVMDEKQLGKLLYLAECAAAFSSVFDGFDSGSSGCEVQLLKALDSAIGRV